MSNTKKNFIISGSGGQGVISLGVLLSNIFMLEGKFVSFSPCYGAEMRGGAVNCEVNMDSEKILCFQHDEVDYVVALNQTSFDKFISKVKKNGTIIVNSSLAKAIKVRDDIKYIFLPLTHHALELKNSKLANSLALGVLSKCLGGFSLSFVKNAYEKLLKGRQEIIQKNIDAYLFGMSLNWEAN